MGKKKKQTNTPSLSSSSKSQPSPMPPVAIVDCLSLRAVAPHNNKQSVNTNSSSNRSSNRSKSGDATVLLTRTDAEQLDVLPDEAVFVLTHDNDNGNNNDNGCEPNDRIRAVIARTRIVGSSNNQSKSSLALTTNATPTSPTKQKQRNLSPGTLQVTSACLWSILVPQQNQEQQTTTNYFTSSPGIMSSPPPPLPERPPGTPSTPSTPFSFRSATPTPTATATATTTTPSPRATTPQKKTDSNTPRSDTTKVNVIVVALESALGDQLSQRLVGTARTVTVRPLIGDNPTTTTTTKTNSADNDTVSLMQALVLAYWTNTHVQVGQHLTISCKGKYTNLQVVNIQQVQDDKTSDEEESSLTIINETNIHILLDKLSLEEKDDDLLSQLLLPCSQNTTMQRLYRITSQTKIVVLSKDSTMESTNQRDNTDANAPASSAQHSPKKQYVVGLERELQAALDVLQAPLLRPNVFARNRQQKGRRGAIRPPRGVLLHGPSGVGKSGLMRQIAQEMQSSMMGVGCQVRFVSCTELQTSLVVVGQAERMLSRYFAKRSKTGTLLVMDDIHLICPRRGAPHNPPGVDQLASTLLSLMDSVDESHATDETATSVGPLMILAATHNPSLLDAALRRPGRLDTEVEIPIPDDPASRASILKFHASNMNDETSFNGITQDEWFMLGKLAKGFNGSDCMLAIKEAIRTAQIRQMESSSRLDNGAGPNLDDLIRCIRQTKPSSIKAVTVEIPLVKWSDIGGMEDVKKELREAIEQPLLQSDLYARLRLPSPRGILLYGPPGCSKTLTARALATEGQMNFLAVKGPELLSKWLGESERALASLFRRARMASPSIIFFDEMDAIASKRGSGDSTSSSRMLSQLLTELDGVSSGSNAGFKNNQNAPRVIVVGATNRPDLLDPALTRPGRMDRMIYVGPPDMASRERIFEIGLAGRPCAESLDIASLASLSDGFSGAEIIAICRDAALMALEEQSQSDATPIISFEHLKNSIASMNRQISPEMIAFYAKYRERSS